MLRQNELEFIKDLLKKKLQIGNYLSAEEKIEKCQDTAPVMTDALPDSVGILYMQEYGYTWEEMLPLTKERALEFWGKGFPIYALYEDDSESMVEDEGQILKHEGLFGIGKTDWRRILFTRTALYPPKNKEEKTELAVHIADRYVLMQQCETGYYYSILDDRYQLLDCAACDAPNIYEAMNTIIKDLQKPRFCTETKQYYWEDLQGKVSVVSEIEIVDFKKLLKMAEEADQDGLTARQKK